MQPNNQRVAKPESGQRMAFVDGLRGVAILMVVVRHFYMAIYGPGIPRWADIFGLGYLGVHLFLLLSGFCVSWAYFGPRHRPFVFRDFIYRRATRILPAYYVALALAIPFAPAMHGSEFAFQILTHVSMTYNLFASSVLAINGAFWSLALEFQLYLLFPLLLWSTRAKGPAITLACVIAVQIVYRIAVARIYGTEWNHTMQVAWSVVGRMGEFTVGIMAARRVAEVSSNPLSASFNRAMPPLCAVLFLAGIVAKQRLGVSSVITDLTFTLGFLCLFMWAGNAQSTAYRILSCRLLANLGVISYSVYLVHEYPLAILAGILRNRASAETLLLVWMAPAIALSVLCGSAFYFLVEKPSISYFSAKRAAAAVIPATA